MRCHPQVTPSLRQATRYRPPASAAPRTRQHVGYRRPCWTTLFLLHPVGRGLWWRWTILFLLGAAGRGSRGRLIVASIHVKFPGLAGRLPEMGTISRSPNREQDSPGFVLERCYFFHDAFIRVYCEIILDNFVGHVLRHRSRWDRRILIGRYS